jgi:hypothetical protein
VNRYARASDHDRRFSAPRMDWSWAQASKLFRGTRAEPDPAPQPSGRDNSYAIVWLLPHVALPHVITLLIGSLLFWLGHFGYLAGFTLGAVKV